MKKSQTARKVSVLFLGPDNNWVRILAKVKMMVRHLIMGIKGKAS